MTQAKKFSIKISIHHYLCFPNKSADRIFTAIIFPKLVINAIPKQLNMHYYLEKTLPYSCSVEEKKLSYLKI